MLVASEEVINGLFISRDPEIIDGNASIDFTPFENIFPLQVNEILMNLKMVYTLYHHYNTTYSLEKLSKIMITMFLLSNFVLLFKST